MKKKIVLLLTICGLILLSASVALAANGYHHNYQTAQYCTAHDCYYTGEACPYHASLQAESNAAYCPYAYDNQEYQQINLNCPNQQNCPNAQQSGCGHGHGYRHHQ